VAYESITVTEASVAALKQMSQTLQNLILRLDGEYSRLMEAFEADQPGLGPHDGKLRTLLQELDVQSQSACQTIQRLILKVEAAAAARSVMLTDSPYKSGSGSSPEAILGRIYDGEYRQRQSPRETTADGRHQGNWQGNTFVISDGFVPGKSNPGGLTFGQLRQQYRDRFGIDYTGTPYIDGYADFSHVAVARVDLHEMVDAVLADHPELYDAKNGVDFQHMFSDSHRSRNFSYADALAAAKQLPIPGLMPGYCADDLAAWRKANRFTWDESLTYGYLLVPGFIHNNTAHTGLVGIDTHSADAEDNFAARHKPQVTDPF